MTLKGSRLLALGFGLLLTGASTVFAQDPGAAQAPKTDQTAAQTAAAPTRAIPAGQKLKLKGTIVDRDADTFIIRDESGAETTVLLTDRTSVKSSGGFLRSGQNYDVTNLLRGLAVQVEGAGNTSGQLVATRVRFTQNDLRVARSIETRVSPVEGRLTQVEATNRSLAGQVDELNQVSQAIRGDVDRANANISTTNERISALDDYDVAQESTVLFKVNSAVLTDEAKSALDTIAQQALTQKGYVIEVAGFTDTTGSVEKNQILSQKRADAVVRYLAESHDIPLRRMITPFGYGETKAVADNTTKVGREQNRRVEVKVLVSRGINQAQPTQASLAP